MNSPGVALFRDGLLIAAARVSAPDRFLLLPDGERWLEVARLIVQWAARTGGSAITEVIFERPQWYARAKSKGDPNQLAGVAGVAANVTGMLGACSHIAVFSPTPAEWIGQLSKVCPACKGKAKKKCKHCYGSAWETPRGRFIGSRLNSGERMLVPDQNDAIDAAGLGLFARGRLKPHTVLSNGRDGR